MAARLAPVRYDSLPDVPEPSENPVLVGHENVVAPLIQSYQAGRMHHGLLLAGPRGVGKATFAFSFARYLLSNPDPGNAASVLEVTSPESPLFRQIACGTHHAVQYLTRAPGQKNNTFRTEITVGQVRETSRFLSMKSHDGSYRVVIVDAADDLNRNAANALLKSLEEPPAKTVFMLISHVPGRIIATIRSRCQMLRFHPLADADLSRILNGFSGSASQDSQTLEAVVGEANGSVREAILMSGFGGHEIVRSIDSLVGGKQFSVDVADKLATAVSGREKAIQFDLFNHQLLSRIEKIAGQQALAGNGAAAARMSAFWVDAAKRTRETMEYNLDRRQHVFGLLHRFHDAMHQG